MATNGNTNGATSPALKGLNFNEALKRERVPIAKGDETWQLRDDIPSEVMIRVPLASALGARWKEEADRLEEEHATVAEIRAAMTAVLDEVKAEWRGICTLIFQHTYPAWTEEDTAQHFTFDQQQEIAGYFFTQRMRGSQPPASATSPASAPETVDAAPAATPRATAGRR